jgi:hypothetical protein
MADTLSTCVARQRKVKKQFNRSVLDFYDRSSKWREVDDEKVRDGGLVLQTDALSRN